VRRSVTSLLIAGMLALVSVGAIACVTRGPSPKASGSRSSFGSTATTTTPSEALPGLRPWVASAEWTLVEFVRDGEDYPDTNGPPFTITLRMRTEDSSVSGSSGCNTYSGTYAAEGVALRLRLTAFSKKACSSPIVALEQLYLQALSRVETYGFGYREFSYRELLLGNADGRTILWFHTDIPVGNVFSTETPAPSTTPSMSMSSPPLPRITDRTWTLTRFTQDGRDYPLGTRDLITLWLQTKDPARSSIGGQTACHHFSGSYVANGATLRLQPGTSYAQQVRCQAAPLLMELEYLDALWLVEMYRIEDGQLVLASAGGRLLLTFREDPCDKSGSSGTRMAPTRVFSGTPSPPTPCPSV
jgi:heat shock protein HslJ